MENTRRKSLIARFKSRARRKRGGGTFAAPEGNLRKAVGASVALAPDDAGPAAALAGDRVAAVAVGAIGVAVARVTDVAALRLVVVLLGKIG